MCSPLLLQICRQMPSSITDKSSVIAVFHIHYYIFKSTHLRYCWKCVDSTICLVFHNSCKLNQYHSISAMSTRVRSNPTQLQFCIFTPKYSNQRISVSIADMSIIRCALYSVIVTKYSSHHLVRAMSNPDPAKSSVNAVMHDQGSIFRST